MILARIPSLLRQLLLIIVIFVVASVLADKLRQPAHLEQVNLDTDVTLIEQQSLPLKHADKLTVLYFWGSWCGVCKHASPQVQRFVANPDYRVISIAMDSGTDQEIAAHLSANKLTFATVNDTDSQLAGTWGVQVVPTIVVIDDSRVLQSFTGFNSYMMMRAKVWLAQLL